MKRTALLLTMVMALVMIFALSGCSFDATLTQGTFVEDTFVEDLLVKSYNINFVVNGETTTVTCKQGLVPTAPAVENYETDSKSYTFIGWDKPIVAATEDATYTAIFSGSTKFYEVSFVYGEDKSATTQLHWGADVKGEAPTSGLNYQTVDKVYTFTGWDKELVPVNGDVVYTAQYDVTAREYKVTFNYDGKTEDVTFKYGDTVVFPTPAGYSDAAGSYAFKAWDKEAGIVTGDDTYTAEYVMTAKVLYSQNFDDKDFDQNSSAARYNEVLDSTWTLNLMAGGAYAKTEAYANDPSNKYVVAGLLADNSGATAQLNAKDASKKGGAGSLASMGDFTKLTFSVDLAAKEGVALPKGYLRLRGSSNYMIITHNRDGHDFTFNGADVAGVSITTTMQTFTFEFDFEACTATLLVDGVQKYTGAINGITDGKAYIAGCKEYLFNWAFENTKGESALIIDNLSVVAH